LVEAEVSARYGVSKSPAREALKVLQQEGLVDVIPRRGYVVAPITVKQIKDLFDLRLILEREAAMVAARTASEEDIALLRRLSGDRYVPGDPDSYARFLTQNRSFHLAVAQVSRNERLTAVLARLLDDLERLFHLGLDVRDRSETLIHEHHGVVDAIVARDPTRAAAAMAAQIENSRQMVLEAVMSGALVAQVG
jgi:DNA-binding GntR family transcriptional regulator